MRSARALLPVALLALAPVLTACGQGDDAEAKDDSAPSSESAVDRTSEAASDATTDATSAAASDTTTAPAGDLPAACDVVEKIDIATAYGATPAAGQQQDDSCVFVAKRFFTTTVALAPMCETATEQDAKPVKVKGADSATWEQTSSDPFSSALLVCDGDTGLSIKLDFEPAYQHEGDPQLQSIGLAETILKRL